jgi:hypothetical protein
MIRINAKFEEENFEVKIPSSFVSQAAIARKSALSS